MREVKLVGQSRKDHCPFALSQSHLEGRDRELLQRKVLVVSESG